MPIKDKIYQLGDNKAQRVWVDVGSDISLEDGVRASHQANGCVPLLTTTVIIPSHCENKAAVMQGLGGIDAQEERSSSNTHEVRITFKPQSKAEATSINKSIDEILREIGYMDISQNPAISR